MYFLRAGVKYKAPFALEKIHPRFEIPKSRDPTLGQIERQTQVRTTRSAITIFGGHDLTKFSYLISYSPSCPLFPFFRREHFQLWATNTDQPIVYRYVDTTWRNIL